MRVLDEAERLFRTHGYNAVTMRDIAVDVGIRQASLYYHFQSKEELFVAVTERVFERHRTGLLIAINNAEDNLRSQLHAAAGWFLSVPPVYFLSMAHTDMPLLGKENTQKLSICYAQSIFEPLGEIFAHARERKEIREARPKVLAGFFLSVMESIPYVANLPGTSPGEVEAIVNEMVDILLDGLKPDVTDK
ncbi:MAG: TetR/AcrR family transcriptional regulator [Cyanomargarita calcarea GSE-NOS-MK-12-04C]|jgi:AcrR family transcriptional regulator|uniref:TetR/AcrR family transcriptional regulator n=1 Tax=Cyanomargarita calcarea GSE-NOS-MK-12-04C TaxID=2839659 RepID=A0A951QU39_9CYAN|nr:TetR/AcrR family transcriptional regulator [Cyanomargarita calcarea GSE-NOS-MK-12-04C]